MSCPVPENFVVRKSWVKKDRHSIILLQNKGLIPKEPKELFCNLLPYSVKTLEFIFRHGCLKKCNGTPCQHLLWLDYEGFPPLPLGILKLLGWGKQYTILQWQRRNYLQFKGVKEPLRSELLAKWRLEHVKRKF